MGSPDGFVMKPDVLEPASATMRSESLLLGQAGEELIRAHTECQSALAGQLDGIFDVLGETFRDLGDAIADTLRELMDTVIDSTDGIELMMANHQETDTANENKIGRTA